MPTSSCQANAVGPTRALHNLIRWTATIGQPRPVDQLTAARTIRQRLIAIPARIVNLAGTLTLRGPNNWPWAQSFQTRLRVIRLLTPATG